MAYAGDGECDSRVNRAVADGVNVVIWFALTFECDPATGAPVIAGGPDLACVGRVAGELKAANLTTLHMISVGGWDTAHPNTTVSGQGWWEAWQKYNQRAIDAGLEGGFDGVDWDEEGMNDPTSVWNTYTRAGLEIVARFSELAKQAGLLVSLVPPQSYLDCTTQEFSLSLVEPAHCWHSDFHYAGRNAYAAILAMAAPGTFDWVSLQLYETWSVANCELTLHGMSVPDYLAGLVKAMAAGWQVDFASAPSVGLATQTVAVAPTRLVIGLANGWAHPAGWKPGAKTLFIEPADLQAAWEAMEPSQRPRGFVFWVIAAEGSGSPPLYMASALNKFLHTRP